MEGHLRWVMRRLCPFAAFMAASLFSVSSLFAQASGPSGAADTSSPRATLQSFIDACNETYELILRDKYLDASNPYHARLTDRILDCLDVSEIPAFARQHRATEIAICIKEILDREELPPWDEIPDEEEIVESGNGDAFNRYRIPGTRVTIAKVEEGPQKHEYLFSPGTVSRAVENFEHLRPEPYRTDGPSVSDGFHDWYVSVPGNRAVGAIVQRLPPSLRMGTTFGLANWKWLSLAFTLVVATCVMYVCYRLQWQVSARLLDTSIVGYCLTLIFPIIAMLTPFVVKEFLESYLTIRGQPLYAISFISNLIAIFAGIIVIFAAANRIAEAIIASPRINPLGLNAQLIRITAKLVSLSATLMLFIVGGHFLGIPIGTLFASAGIAGAAIALAAQDTLKNLLGTIVLFGDKPFQVGERIKIDSYDGFVEDIGLRSTRIRLLNGHLVTLPNSHLAGTDIENVSSRPHIRRVGEIFIPLDTPCEKVRRAVDIVGEVLEDHEGMAASHPPRIYFEEFESAAFKISFIYWYSPADFWQFREFGQRVNFEIFRRFEQLGIQFSLPFRHSFWRQDDEQGPLDVCLTGKVMPGSAS